MNAFHLELKSFDWYFEGVRGVPEQTAYYANSEVILSVGAESRLVAACQPVVMLRVAESLEKDFCSRSGRYGTSLLACDGTITFLYEGGVGQIGPPEPQDRRIYLHSGVVKRGAPDYSLTHRADGMVAIETSFGTSALLSREEYRERAIRFIESCREHYTKALPSLNGLSRKRFDVIIETVDSLVRFGKPLPGFEDPEFGSWEEVG